MVGGRFANIPPVVKYLLIANAAFLAGTYILENLFGLDVTKYLALHYFKSVNFRPHQFITHMFMHADLIHLLFNMYALWLFGQILEKVWGGKKFLTYYLITGLGAAALHTFVNWIEMSSLTVSAELFYNSPTPETFALFVKDHSDLFNSQGVASLMDKWSVDPTNNEYISFAVSQVQEIVLNLQNIPTVGASGAVFGLLLAFGMLFPNAPLMLIFVPIPIKAKWFVIGYGVIELFYGVSQIPGDNIAHFAHLGGMLFGFILIKIWGKGKTNFFQ